MDWHSYLFVLNQKALDILILALVLGKKRDLGNEKKGGNLMPWHGPNSETTDDFYEFIPSRIPTT